MAKSNKLSQKELKQPDQFQTAGERIMQKVVENRKRYVMYAVLALVLVAVVLGVRAYMEHRQSKVSIAFAEAMKPYNAPIVKEGDTPEDMNALHYKTKQGKYVAASKTLEEFIEAYAGCSYGDVARVYLGNAFFKLGRFKEAREQYELFLRDMASDEPELRFLAFHNIAQSHMAEENFDEALATYNRLLQSDLEIWKDQATYQIALIHKRKNEKEQAIAILDKIVEEFPDSSVKSKADKLLLALRGPKAEEEEEEKPEEADTGEKTDETDE